MSRFETCLKWLLGPDIEGGYSNHKADRGGATNFGVTQAVYDAYRSKRGRAKQSVAMIAYDEVSEIYRNSYWRPVFGDVLPNGVDLVVFDAAVNHGVVQASKFLQRALGVSDDGIVGQETVSAAHKDDISGMTQHVIADILDQRRDFYERLAEKDASQKVFLKGWLNRVAKLAKEVGIRA